MRAEEFTRDAKVDRQAMRAVCNSKMLPALRQGGKALRKIADYIEKLLAEEEELAEAA